MVSLLNFPSLPDELILGVAGYLNDADYISLACSNDRLLKLLALNKRHLNLSCCYEADLESIRFFLDFGRKNIHKLDLSHCYWLEPDFVVQLANVASSSLESLMVHGVTRLQSRHLIEILSQCRLLQELSATFSHEDPDFWHQEEAGNANSCVFKAFAENLSQLKRLELHGDVADYHMITVFLSLCPNLEELSLVELSQHPHWSTEQMTMTTAAERAVDRGRNLRRVERWVEDLLPLLPPYKSLRRLAARTHAVGDLSAHSFLYYLVEQILRDCHGHLEVLWFPHVCVDDFHKAVGADPTALHVTYDSVEQLERGGSTMASLCVNGWYNAVEHAEFISALSAGGKYPRLKMASLSYDYDHFLDFARNHRDLRVLQLQTTTPPGPDFADELGCFSKLRRFSVDPEFFRAAEYYGDKDCVMMEMAFKQLVHNGSLEQVEIGIFPTARIDHAVSSAPSKCLALFSHCAKLERLTLANLRVDKLDFLSGILVGCPRLESLRLTNIKHDFLVSKVVEQLDIGLPSARNLKDFRWELGQSGRGKFVLGQQNTSSSVSSSDTMLIGPKVFHALQRGSGSLRRIAIITDLKTPVQLLPPGTRDEDAVIHFPGLVMACFISPSVDWTSRSGAGSFQLTSDHPAYCSYLGGSKAEAASLLPAVHYNQMVLFDSHVTETPYYH